VHFEIAPKFKKLILSSILVSSGLLAHCLANGSFVGLRQLLIYSLLNLFIVLILNIPDFEGPKLATAILISQAMTHIFSGGNSANSSSMFIWHFVCAGFGYFLALNFDLSLQALSNLIKSALPISFFNFSLPRETIFPISSNRFTVFRSNVFSAIYGRAPPIQVGKSMCMYSHALTY